VHRILLIRHGEAAKSPIDADPGLTELGHQQAHTLAEELIQTLPDPDAVTLISSPKSRAMQTALPVATRWGKTVKEEEAVIEIPSPVGVALTERGEWIQELLVGNWSALTPLQLQWRKNITHYLHQLDAPEHSGTAHTFLVFCHFMVINSVVASIRGDDRVAQFYPDYTSRTELLLGDGQLGLVDLGREKSSGNLIR